MATNIEWTRNPKDGSKGETWPVVTGCTPVSEGCRNCYAARMAATRLKYHPRYKGLAVMRAPGTPRWTGEIRLNHDVLEQPLRWKKPRMVFIASMGDLFHPDVPDLFIAEVWRVMYMAKEHTFQILTKRASRMLDRFSRFAQELVLPNAWLGVSIESQAAADERIPLLLQTPAAVRFVSVEPMLGPIYVKPWLSKPFIRVDPKDEEWNRQLNWVICGGESGPGARPMHPNWVRSLRDQCQAAGVAFFYKQAIINGKKVSCPELDGQQWKEMPDVQRIPV